MDGPSTGLRTSEGGASAQKMNGHRAEIPRKKVPKNLRKKGQEEMTPTNNASNTKRVGKGGKEKSPVAPRTTNDAQREGLGKRRGTTRQPYKPTRKESGPVGRAIHSKKKSRAERLAN